MKNILNFIEECKDTSEFCELLQDNQLITLDFIQRNIQLPWNWTQLSNNKAITPEFIERHLDYPWNWGGLSNNPAITPEFIERHLDKPWHWGTCGLSINESITLEFIERHLDKSWNWGEGGLSSNESITPEFIERHIGKHWDYNYLLKMGIVTLSFIEKHIEQIKKFINVSFCGTLLLKMEHSSVKLIQGLCDNWIDRPITHDGKLGISVRLMYHHVLGYEWVYPHDITNN